VAGTPKSSSQTVQVALLSGASISFNFSANDTSGNIQSCTFSITVIRNPITTQLLQLAAAAPTANTTSGLISQFVNVTQQASNMSSIQAVLSVTVLTTLISAPATNISGVFVCLDQLGALQPAVIASAQTLNNTASQIRDVAVTLAIAALPNASAPQTV
jgi:hypothetical protein